MIDGVELEDGEYGRRAVVTSAWSAEMTKYILDNGVVDLELNDGKGWRGGDILFLVNFSNLVSFEITDLKISSVNPINFLQKLRVLKVITYCKTPIIFSNFPKLEECALEWRPMSDSLFEHTMIKRLFINRYTGSDLLPFQNLVNMESLSILNAPVRNLQGLGGMIKLHYLRLANLSKLNSLAGIERLVNLKSLDINTCRYIKSIEEVRHLFRLEEFFLNNDGNIDSLKPIEDLKNLVSVLFYESTNIVDGDISSLLINRNLSRVSFRNRRHYSHRREEFGNAYTG